MAPSSATKKARALPTRKSKAAAAASATAAPSKSKAAGDVAESRQEGDNGSGDDDSKGATTGGGGASAGASGGGANRDDDDRASEGSEERTPSPPTAAVDGGGEAAALTSTTTGDAGGMKPAFNLHDGEIPTIDTVADRRGGRASPSPSRRSPSPRVGAVSRRGRSRSPVGLHAAPRPGSRASNSRSSSNRPTSRSSYASGGGGAATGGGKNGELSDAALAAGEAAAASALGEPYGVDGRSYHHHHHQQQQQHQQHQSYPGYYPPATSRNRSRSRSPSPVIANAHRGVGGALSFEISPNQSMSFAGVMGGSSGGSFDWNVGPAAAAASQYSGRRSPSPLPPPPHHHHHHRGHHHYDRYDSGEGGYNHGERHQGCSGRHHHHHHHHRGDESGYYQDYPPSYAPDPYRDRHHHHRNGGGGGDGRSPSPPPQGYHPPRPHDGHYGSGRQHHGSRHYRRDSRGGSSPVNPRDLPPPLPRNQALFPEHHVRSPRKSGEAASSSSGRKGRRDDGSGGSDSPVKKPSKSKRGAKAKKAGRSASKKSSSRTTKQRGGGGGGKQSKGRSSVFRGSPTTVKDSLPKELLLAMEDDDEDEDDEDDDVTPPSSPTKKGGKKKGSTTARGGKRGGNGGKNNRSSSPLGSALPPLKLTNRNSSVGTNGGLGLVNNPSMMLDATQIDACLQDTMFVDDYLNSNLSFRKSYDLEQVFSFIKEGPNGTGGPMTSLSFGGVGGGVSRSDEEHVDDRGFDGKRDASDFLPTIQTLQSQGTGLTPINSFGGGDGGGVGASGSQGGDIVPLSSMDGMALRAFFSSSPTTNVDGVSGPDEAAAEEKSNMIGSPPRRGGGEFDMNAPVVHASTPPSYGHRDDHSGGDQHHPQQQTHHTTPPPSRYHHPAPATRSGPHGPPPPGPYASSTPRSPYSPHHRRGPPPPPRSVVPTSFPNKRVRISTRHSLHPMASDLPGRVAGGDCFALLRKMAPCFVDFRFKLHEMVVVGDAQSDGDGKGKGGTSAASMPAEFHLRIARRRVDSSICAFGGSLPPRAVSFDSTDHRPGTAMGKGKEETAEEKAERQEYAEELSSRYLMKEHCISWDVEVHEVITPKTDEVKNSGKGKAIANGSGTPKVVKRKQFEKGDNAMSVSQYCAPVTPSTPNSSPGSNNADSPGSGSSPGSTATPKKGSKVKYRCKLCGQPKQNHTCPYTSSLVRSIGTMVYPAVNAFVSNEPGRCAPPLSEMNNFTCLLSQDSSLFAGGSQRTGAPYGPPHRGLPMHGRPFPPHGPPRGAPYNILSPETSHWSPNTPGGLSTMSSHDANSPGAPPPAPSRPVIGGPPSRSSGHKRDHHNQLLMSRTHTMSRTLSHPMPPRPPAAPAGAIPSDVLFRDTMELKQEQYRTVGATPSTAGGVGSTSIKKLVTSPNAYRYPPVPTPYAQRKEMGDTLFALSREVPKLADSCAAILRDARENDLWDQAVAELTTQVLVVLKCDDEDYTLEGLRRHLTNLGISC